MKLLPFLLLCSLFANSQCPELEGGQYWTVSAQKGPAAYSGKIAYTLPGLNNLTFPAGVEVVTGSEQPTVALLTLHLQWSKGELVRPIIRAGVGYGVSQSRMAAMGEFAAGIGVGALELTAGKRVHPALLTPLNGWWLGGGINF